MKRTKVLFAYCHELKRSVSIDEARLEYFAIKPEDRARFTFSCSDRNCGVLISGVNYHVMAEDGVKFKAAHYRSPHPHMPTCEWVQFTDADDRPQLSDESDEEFNQRKARRKLRDSVNYFTPWTENDDVGEDASNVLEDSDGLSEPSVHQDGEQNKKDHNRWQRYTRTNQLQRLIDTWQEAKLKLSYDEFWALKLHVANHGSVYFGHYVTHIRNGPFNQYGGVIYGGGVLKQRYGRGFLFQFFDEYNDKPIRLYVDKKLMINGRFGHYIDEILETQNVKYFQMFLLNPTFKEREDARGDMIVDLKISDLRQLVVYYELKTSTSAESVSDDKCGDN